MNEIQETIVLRDSITDEEALIIVRLVEKNIGICLSLRNDGDAEIFLNLSDCQNLIDKLQKLIEQVT